MPDHVIGCLDLGCAQTGVFSIGGEMAWIMKNPKLYAEGVFRGFVVDPLGRKS